MTTTCKALPADEVDTLWHSESKDRRAQAKALCRACPARDACRRAWTDMTARDPYHFGAAIVAGIDPLEIPKPRTRWTPPHPAPEGRKWCKRCAEALPRESFWTLASGALYPYCKPCARDISRAHEARRKARKETA